MADDTARRVGSTVAGCAAVAALAAALMFIAVSVIVTIAVQGFFERPEPSPAERLGKQSGLTLYRLDLAARDGRLTDAEISRAARAAWAGWVEWTVQRGPDVTRVVVGYEPGPVCYRFEVPLSPPPSKTSSQGSSSSSSKASSVKRHRLSHCPVFNR